VGIAWISRKSRSSIRVSSKSICLPENRFANRACHISGIFLAGSTPASKRTSRSSRWRRSSPWIICCSGRRQISKTSCSISGPTSTTIARIIHWKGEHPIRRCHDQSQISARLDGSVIVDPYFRPQWLPNFSKIQAHCGIRSGLQKSGMKSRVFALLVAVRFAAPIVSLPPGPFKKREASPFRGAILPVI
jgi:hypothetical protein